MYMLYIVVYIKPELETRCAEQTTSKDIIAHINGYQQNLTDFPSAHLILNQCHFNQ